METRVSRIQGGGRHSYAVTVPYSDRQCLTVEVELTEKQTSEGHERIRPAALAAAVSALEKARAHLQHEIDP